MKRIIVITGATSGFGCALVKEFLNQGDHVIATGRNLSDRSDIFKTERAQYKNQLIEKNLDVTLEKECLDFKNYIEESGQNIDVLINNAGYALFGALEDTSMEQIRDQFEVNFFGLTRITQNLLPSLVKSKGKILNFSSVFGFTGFPLTSAYCASKFAVEGFSESLDYELRPHGVQVCLIQPGGYRTKFGSSAVWGKSSKALYKTQTDNYQILRNKMMTKKNFQDPNDLAHGVYKLTLKKNLPLRVPFGKDAKMTSIIKKFMPASILHSITHKMFNKLFMKRHSNAN